MRRAVIGIGSNSVRMLVCDILGKAGTRLLRDRAGTRLFAGLDAERRLGAEAMEKTAAAVAGMAEKARGMGVEEIRLFATSATRDAANADAFASLLLSRAGLSLEIISGEEEAVLSYLGASGGGHAGVIDIGGGSTEIVIGEDERIDTAFSCQIGAVRLSRMLPIDDVPGVARAVRAAEEIIRPEAEKSIACVIPEKWAGTGGTFTCLASLRNRTAWDDRTHTHGTAIGRTEAAGIAAMLAKMTLEERRKLLYLQPSRADIVVHGICILLACMDTLGIDSIRVSEYGNLDGFFRREWRTELA